MSVKHEKTSNQIMKNVSDIIQYDLKDPSVGFVTITGVKVTNDYSYATIYCSFLGKTERKKAGLKALQRAKGFIRSELGKKMQIRKIPELIFELDESLERGQRIESILNEIEKENNLQK